ncbi:MAG: hypothetical protein H6838_05180 [Planctomycetes bacterium]|nr:hypothetical protein [Planctomycetota bacterium]
MRAVVVTLLLLALALGVWLWRGNTQAPALPEDVAAAPGEQPSATAPAASERLEATPTAPSEEPTAPAAAPADGPQPGAPAAARPFQLVVVDALTRQPVPEFRVNLRLPGGGMELRSRTGSTEVDVPAGTRGELLVEAQGYEPWHRIDFVAPPAEPQPAVVTVELNKAAVAAGITLHVHDTALQPVSTARVEAFQLGPGARDTDWWNGKPLWSRRATAEDGRYTLPTLAPGDYGIRVLAVDAKGTVLPFLPYTHVFALTGSNGFVEDVPLEAGCIPEFEVVDAYGKLLVPGTPSIGLSLRVPGGPDVSRQWLVEQQGEVFRGLDLLPGVGPAWPEVPVAAGAWQFEVRRDGRTPHVEAVSLRSGERQRIRVSVP